jgi:hypothetical protein
MESGCLLIVSMYPAGRPVFHSHLCRSGMALVPPAGTPVSRSFDQTSARIDTPVQNVFLQLFARLNVTLKWRFQAGRIQIRQLVPHFGIENVIWMGTVQDFLG